MGECRKVRTFYAVLGDATVVKQSSSDEKNHIYKTWQKTDLFLTQCHFLSIVVENSKIGIILN